MISNISIPKPCQQSWLQMTVADNGRHCQSCCKTIVDFTKMSNRELLNYLSDNKSICGKFEENQIASINSKVSGHNKDEFSWKSLIAAASIISLFPSFSAEAKIRPTVEFNPSIFKSNQESTLIDSNRLITIKGKLIDNDDKLPLPGVNIMLKGTTSKTITNINGEFKMQVPPSSTVVMNFLGYQTQEIASKKFAGSELQTICVQAQRIILGEVIVYKKVPFYKRWFYKVKRIF